MNRAEKEIEESLSIRKKLPLPENPNVKKLIILVFLSALATVLFFPPLSPFHVEYKPGDVAVTDVKSPVEVSSNGITVKKGEAVVRDGQVLTEADIERLLLVRSSANKERSVLPAAGFFLFIMVLISMSYLFASGNIRKFSTIPKDLLLMSSVLAGVLILITLSVSLTPLMSGIFPAIPLEVYKFVIPVAVGPMLIRLLLNSESAFIFAAVSSIMAGFFMGGSLEAAAYSLIGGLTAAMGVRHCTHRSVVIRAGLILGAVNVITILSIYIIKGGLAASGVTVIAFAGFLNGLVTAILAVGTAPFLESIFQYTTNIRLLELSRMDHPLLKELAMRAPGTYHHSIVIGTLVEAAAESINANPLLARVAAYYHDIGKLKMPSYYIENISDENKHDKLAPSMSSLILVSHIKEGVELAKSHRLGQEIIDIINQHHGTSLITYFYQKAVSKEEAGVDEVQFRYPGPKPQTKEAGIVMLADAIEAASKTLPDPSPEKIQWLTQKIVNRIFTDGQLDECELTLKDLHSITKSFNRVFAGIYHQRIDYPEPVHLLKEREIEGSGRGQEREEGSPREDKKNGRDGLKRLGIS